MGEKTRQEFDNGGFERRKAGANYPTIDFQVRPSIGDGLIVYKYIELAQKGIGGRQNGNHATPKLISGHRCSAKGTKA